MNGKMGWFALATSLAVHRCHIEDAITQGTLHRFNEHPFGYFAAQGKQLADKAMALDSRCLDDVVHIRGNFRTHPAQHLPEPQPEAKKTKKLGWILSGIAALLLLCAAGGLLKWV
jgi:hypothetical protein